MPPRAATAGGRGFAVGCLRRTPLMPDGRRRTMKPRQPTKSSGSIYAGTHNTPIASKNNPDLLVHVIYPIVSQTWCLRSQMIWTESHRESPSFTQRLRIDLHLDTWHVYAAFRARAFCCTYPLCSICYC